MEIEWTSFWIGTLSGVSFCFVNLMLYAWVSFRGKQKQDFLVYEAILQGAKDGIAQAKKKHEAQA